MANNKKKNSRRRRSTSAHTGGYMGIAKRGLCVVAGLAAGTYVKNFIGQRSVNGTDLLGLSGDMSQYTTPAIVTAVGAVGLTMCKNPMLKDVALGVVAAGGAGLVNAATGKALVSLSGTEDQPVVPLLPGIGDVDPNIRYDQLPSENEQVTTYNPVTEAGDIDIDAVNGTDTIL